jgi:hypothetical protein
MKEKIEIAFVFTDIQKYYHVLVINEEKNYYYIYELIDKYIDILFDKKKFDKSTEISEKTARLVKEEKKMMKKKLFVNIMIFWPYRN